MKETLIEQKFVRLAKKYHCKAVKFQDPQMKGAPDRLVLCPKGKIFFIEFKATGKIETDINRFNDHEMQQYHYHEMLRALNFGVYVCDSVEDAMKILLEFLKT